MVVSLLFFKSDVQGAELKLKVFVVGMLRKARLCFCGMTGALLGFVAFTCKYKAWTLEVPGKSSRLVRSDFYPYR